MRNFKPWTKELDFKCSRAEHRNLTIYIIIRWLSGSLGQITCWPSVWCSKYYFFFIISCKILCKNRFYLFFWFFNNKMFEFPNKLWKEKRMLGWWVVCPIDPASQYIIMKIVGFQSLKTTTLSLISHFVNAVSKLHYDGILPHKLMIHSAKVLKR